jgi:hypothetical protein
VLSYQAARAIEDGKRLMAQNVFGIHFLQELDRLVGGLPIHAGVDVFCQQRLGTVADHARVSGRHSRIGALDIERPLFALEAVSQAPEFRPGGGDLEIEPAAVADLARRGGNLISFTAVSVSIPYSQNINKKPTKKAAVVKRRRTTENNDMRETRYLQGIP